MSGKREILSAFALHKNSAFEIHATLITKKLDKYKNINYHASEFGQRETRYVQKRD
jgi:hypothetical protein